MSKKKIMVIGLGILGETIARTLAEDGAEVIALDQDPVYIERIKDVVAMAVEGDSTDPKMLEQLGVKQLDTAIVCIGENFPGALMTTVQLLDLGVKHVSVRATSQMHYDILKKIGAHDVFFVESEMGRAIAHRLQSPDIINEIDLGFGLHMVETHVCEWMVGKTLAELSLPKQKQIQVVAARDVSSPKDLLIPYAGMTLTENMQLMLVGKHTDLTRLLKGE